MAQSYKIHIYFLIIDLHILDLNQVAVHQGNLYILADMNDSILIITAFIIKDILSSNLIIENINNCYTVSL
jgi:hypothetical protein